MEFTLMALCAAGSQKYADFSDTNMKPDWNELATYALHLTV